MAVPHITALPAAPTRSDPTNFNAVAVTFIAAWETFRTEMNTSALYYDGSLITVDAAVDAVATSAAAALSSAAAALSSAAAALVSETNAQTASAAEKWVSGTTYAIGGVVWSPENYMSYRSKSAFTSTTDPSSDGTNWALISFEQLAAYADTIAATAVDVFVYDTSLDSDGGAWRERTQGTSWYSETLNTSTRGATRKFPAVAVIVVEASKITIYDADDPALPMWMVFNGAALLYGSTRTSVTILNGIVFTGGNNSVSEINFLTEFMGLHQGSSISQTKSAWSSGIVKRNDTSGSWLTEGAGTGSVIKNGALVNAATNDVAMTVLPGAPIDSATGLPIPTIAVATDGGVSVIKDDGNVWDSSPATATSVVAINDNILTFTRADEFRTIDINNITGDGFTYDNRYQEGSSASSTYTPQPLSSMGGASSFDSTQAIRGGNGLSLLKENTTTPANGSVAYITSDYNTGWMVGDTKGAWLSDTDTTNITGAELVTNGDFATDTDWTGAGSGDWAISGGKAHGNGGWGDLFSNADLGTVVGLAYVITYTVSNHVSGSIKCAGGAFPNGAWRSANGTYTETMVAVATTTVRFYSSNLDASIDDVSVRLADPDRSVNANGLQVFGTITKTAVATGAELVAYSGFSASNYLEQPYNSDLDFGTGDFAFSGWVEQTSAVSNQNIFEKHDGATSANLFAVSIHSGVLKAYLGGWKTSTLTFTLNEWTLINVVRASGVLKMYANGVEVYSAANTTSVTLVGAVTFVGQNYSLTWPLLGGLALFRIGATAPTAAQILSIYNDEKPMFAAGSDVTLYGSSDAVTALAHDPVTKELHVGTSAGRSTFQGLKRIANTTSAVTDAISAVDGLVSEQ